MMILLSLLIMVSFIETEKINERPFEIVRNNKLLKKLNIKSLTVYVSLEVTDYDAFAGFVDKIEEMEFDKNGNQIYRLTAYGNRFTHFIHYGRGGKIQTAKYDQHNRLVRTYYEDFKTTVEIILGLDKKGNLINYEYSYNGQPLKKIELNAEIEQGIHTNIKHTKTSASNLRTHINTYEKKAITSNGSEKSEYRYKYFGDSSITNCSYFVMDTLVMTEFYTTLSKIDQITYYRKTDHLGRIEIEMKAKFDEFGNLIYYSRFEYDTDKTYAEFEHNLTARIEFRIKNKYDKHGLLVKRYFYNVDQNNPIGKLETVEGYWYDRDKLTFKFEEGYIFNTYQGK
jgi:hypothetical protein